MAETLRPVAVRAEEPKISQRPQYEPPRIQVMTEREILAQFQITQSMNSWWSSGMC